MTKITIGPAPEFTVNVFAVFDRDAASKDYVNALVPTYVSRAAFQGAMIPAPLQAWAVIHNGEAFSYFRDDSGTAIESANGVKGSPLGPATPGHYGAVSYGSLASVVSGTDSAAALQACFDKHARVVIKGYFRSTATLTISNKSFCIESDVIASGIIFTQASGDGIVYTSNNVGHTFQADGLRILTNQQEPGRALVVDFSAVASLDANRRRMAYIVGTEVGGVTRTSHGWAKGIVLDEANEAHLSSVTVYGRRNTAASGEANFWPGMESGIEFLSTTDKEPVNPTVENSRVRGAYSAIRVRGAVEGVNVLDTVVVASRIGVDDDRSYDGGPTSEPLLFVRGCHFAVSESAIKAKRVAQGMIKNNLIYRFAQVDMPFIGISGETGSWWQIMDNHVQGFCGSTANTVAGVKVNQVHHSTIEGNDFLDVDTGVIVSDEAGGINGVSVLDNYARDDTGAEVQMITFAGTATEAAIIGKRSKGCKIVTGKNSGNITVAAGSGNVMLGSIDLDAAPAGAMWRLEVECRFDKGETQGVTQLVSQRSTGTSTAVFFEDASNLSVREAAQPASSQVRLHVSGIIRKPTAGTLTLGIYGASNGSDATVSDGNAQWSLERIF